MRKWLDEHRNLILTIIILLLIAWQVVSAIYPARRLFNIYPEQGLIICCLFMAALLIKLLEPIAKHFIYGGILSVLFSIGISVLITYLCGRLENTLSKKDYNCQIGYILNKGEAHYNTKGSAMDNRFLIGLNDYLNRYKNVEKTEFQKRNIGDTIIIRLSKHGGIYVKKIFPSPEEIAKFRVPQHYVNGELQEKPTYEQYSIALKDSMLQQSHCCVGNVYDIIDDEYYRHLVNVGIDSLHTTTHEFVTTDRLYTKVYKRLNIGDKVILQVSDSLPEINRVINWQPTADEIELYRASRPFDEKMIVRDYSRCSKEFEKEKLHESHKRLGVIYDKYKDDYVGAYLEVGIDEKHTRAHLFHTYDKKEMEIYKGAAVGDTVIIRVSDALPQLNKVLNWHPTHEEIEKYKTPVKLVEKK